jgi:hypothetical protein
LTANRSAASTPATSRPPCMIIPAFTRAHGKQRGRIDVLNRENYLDGRGQWHVMPSALEQMQLRALSGTHSNPTYVLLDLAGLARGLRRRHLLSNFWVAIPAP